MSIEVISMNGVSQNNNDKNGSSNTGSSNADATLTMNMGTEAFDGFVKYVENANDNDASQNLMSLHRECKDDDMYDSSSTPSMTSTTNTGTTDGSHTTTTTTTSVHVQTPPPPLQQDTPTTSTDTTLLLQPPPPQQQLQLQQLPTMIVSNKCETLFISSDGDVLTSRCRYSPYSTTTSSSSSTTALSMMMNDTNNIHRHNNNSSSMNTSAFPNVLAAVVCCDHSSYTHHHHSNHSNQPYEHGNHSNPDSEDDSPNQNQYDHDPDYIQLHTTAPPTSNNPTTTTTTTSNTANGDDHHVYLDDRDASVAGRASVSSRSISGGEQQQRGHLLPIQSFDHSQYSTNEAAAFDDWSSPQSSSRPHDTHFHISATTTTTTSKARTFTTALSLNHQGTPSNGGSHNTTTKTPRRPQPQQQNLFHGIPTFVSYFSSIKIRHVSAHPMGAHVLLISHPGILYAYGLNTYGQLGLGWKSHHRDIHQGYVRRPTIVTALLENGGKTITGAAGVSHSLVVVEVEEQRMRKSQSLEMITTHQSPRGSRTHSVLRTRQQSQLNDDGSTASIQETEIVKYHQMYGFGRNDFMKIGLIRPKVAVASSSQSNQHTTNPTTSSSSSSNQQNHTDPIEHVLFPRRVALRCSVIHKKVHQSLRGNVASSSPTGDLFLPPKGIFAIAASAEHSAALVHQPNGDIELYTWGNATYGTLGLPPSSFVTSPLVTTTTTSTTTTGATVTASFRIAPYPSLVACLSKTTNLEPQPLQLLRNDMNEFPMAMSLSRCCSFVVTNLGRCFSFGTSEDGMLGLGRSVTETPSPMEIALPDEVRHEQIISVSAGTQHVTVCTNVGHVYSWGARSHAGFDIQTSSSMSQQQNRKPPTIMKGPTPIEDLIQFEWSPRRVELSNATLHGRSKSYTHHLDTQQKSPKIVQARAGNDCTFFITESGKVLSSGKSSGRFGQGEYDTDITVPKPVFGGLHLFQQKENNHISTGVSTRHNGGNDNTHLQSMTTTTSLRSKARRLASV